MTRKRRNYSISGKRYSIMTPPRKNNIAVWTQNLTPMVDAVTAAPQETRDLLRETHDQIPRTLLAGCSLAEPSLAELSLAEPSQAEPSLAEPSRDQTAEYDWWI